ncbi:hypothetical protein IMSHALPRED_010865 [Imshaugia aleurites]|uniref:Uncharacterized protein n=1 Tax=Imshaugia aleurites TaxID=172621 RepID=A0A8H3IZH3_9LECA|nr:hypothetical protein IMSHALPRED_010865 [Imshaugia aleurites]
MRTSTLFTLASLFLLGSYSLPQPKNTAPYQTQPTESIEKREADIPQGGPPPSAPGHGWEHHKPPGGFGSGNDTTKIKERENESLEQSRTIEKREADIPGGGPDTIVTGPAKLFKIKERQGPRPSGPPGGWAPPDGMTWMEWMKHKKHKGNGGSPSQASSMPESTGTTSTSELSSSGYNSTEKKMMMFRD